MAAALFEGRAARIEALSVPRNYLEGVSEVSPEPSEPMMFLEAVVSYNFDVKSQYSFNIFSREVLIEIVFSRMFDNFEISFSDVFMNDFYRF